MRLFTLLLMSFVGTTIAAEPSALATYKFEGMPLATTLPTFQRAYPRAILENKESEPRVGLQVFMAPETKATDGARCHFIDGRLYQVQAIYYPERITKMGGVDAMLKKMLSSLGTPESSDRSESRVSVSWNRTDVGRKAEFVIVPSVACFTITDTKMEQVLNGRRAKHVSLGFE